MGIDMTTLREKEKTEAEAAAAAAAEATAQKERSTYEQLLADAETAAKYGDTAKLRALGIDTSQYDSKFTAGGAQKNTGGAGSSAKTVSADFQTDPSAALYAVGAETFNQAYALLISNGYSSTAATTIANVVEYLIKGGTSAAASLGVGGKDITSGKEAAYMYLYKLVENGLDPSVAESIAKKYGISAPADMRA